MVKSLKLLASLLKKETVAEWIETSEIKEKLAD